MYKLIIILALLVSVLGMFYFTIEEKLTENPTKKEKEPDPSVFSYWKTFKANSGKFEVLLPSTPQYAKDYVEIPKSDKKRRYEIYASEKLDGTVFMVSVITYPNEVDTSKAPEILKEVVDELVAGRTDSKLIDLQETNYHNQLAYTFDIDNEKLRTHGIIFLMDKTIYILSNVVRKEDYNSAEFKHFFDSFTLISKK